jgi:protein phosphatase
MGATLVVFAVCGTNCAVLNIGDSRAYICSGGILTQITKDNTEGQRMLDLGILSRKELLDFPARKNLNRYLGYGSNGFILQADVYYPQIGADDTIMLCSDGVTDSLTDSNIREILCAEDTLAVQEREL